MAWDSLGGSWTSLGPGGLAGLFTCTDKVFGFQVCRSCLREGRWLGHRPPLSRFPSLSVELSAGVESRVGRRLPAGPVRPSPLPLCLSADWLQTSVCLWLVH